MNKSVVHVYWQLCLAEKKKMSVKAFAEFLRFYKIPKMLRMDVIEEMVKMELITTDTGIVIPINCDYKKPDFNSRVIRRRELVKQVPGLI